MPTRTYKAEITNLSPHNKAMLEAGKKMIVDSIDVGREFCKFMITTSISAVPVYFAVLAFAGIPNVLNSNASIKNSLLLLAPSLIFIISALLYMRGYLPDLGVFSLDSPDEIGNERKKIINRRSKYINWATSLFIFGVAISAIVLTFSLLS